MSNNMSVRSPSFSPALPFLKPWLPSYSEVENNIKNILASGMLTKGDLNNQYENAVSHYLGGGYVIAVSSATTGLIMTLLALNITGEVLVPSFTFCATANAIVRAGAIPVFVDCDPETYTICPDDLEKKITSRTQAILAVHVFGVPAQCEKLARLAVDYDLNLIFDSAHAMGSVLDGMKIGNFGDAEVFSTTPTKTLVTGEGGLIVTRDPNLARHLRALKEYGNTGDYDNPWAGLNGRLSEMQCALGLASLQHLEESVALRNSLAGIYRNMLCAVPGIELQTIPANVRTTFKDISVVIDKERFGCDRDELADELQQEGIPTRKYFYPALHQMKAFREYAFGPLPHTERIAAGVLCLPLYPDLASRAAEKVGEVILSIHHRYQEKRLEGSPQ
ncbi:UNVERIFIED_ORG: dTDP-4-amino-4,6-dideoxygalactose transaminase [Kosakonia oryzae]|uniref:dTDP-4-amino-4,6-dideoxygalactose transaminase n=1 Tax=Kosakonia radicincitans TaxID=283686 RepID=A0AAX2EW28_9ENTR|nr:DegT/DnrJ/EryC1/StrS family aminotransferase [Kosakonia radicincitans]MDP9568873.1 dTDP-4-amino-4,6-dideoxygalactose transaminase [Kosakonia oryzae]SFF14186.1 dTDP-4-amino-4,6-dideoxygalactose transaminase [Kosakonia radicincitans]SFR21877.1 dTDP-4-amino-4,6-dideoxygalactose transaminase [Kosakonia radicincitans]SFT98212.1 dTDP-4-amino-4,6-dideoxygalactose transaminase [Kosakonia radicincitans]SFY13064.1 dTDP-4-amino-4,6-dideoxygalactose transaminase [Kosakonia radicincitans]